MREGCTGHLTEAPRFNWNIDLKSVLLQIHVRHATSDRELGNDILRLVSSNSIIGSLLNDR